VNEAKETNEAIEAAWQRLLESWGDADAHRKFVALAASLGALAEAGARYRHVREKDPARADVAAAQIAKIVAAAVSGLEPLRTPPRKRPPLALYVIAALVSAALLAGIFYALQAFEGR
jgi:hypothetical protein